MELPLLAAAAVGAAAGLSVAVPLGPVGLLLVQVAARRGARVGAAGAAAIAGVDTVYSALAVGAGAVLLARSAEVLAAARPVAALVLIGLGVATAATWRRAAHGAGERPPPRSGGRTFAGFLALTASNPGTLVHASLVAAALGSRLASAPSRAVFVMTLGLASLAWQLVLVWLGARLGRSPRPVLHRLLRLVGGVTVAVLGVGLLLASR